MKPFMVGVAGGSGSGKTTVARNIAAAVPPSCVTVLEHDCYYVDRGDLSFEARCALNFDHPASLETALLREHLRALKRGETIEVPTYDFVAHRRSPRTHRVQPTKIVVVEGILIFADDALRAEFDLKLFVDTDPDLRVLRRVQRDMDQRGRTFESVLEQYHATVRPMHLEFVEPSKRYADLVIPEGGNNQVALDLIIAKMRSLVTERDA